MASLLEIRNSFMEEFININQHVMCEILHGSTLIVREKLNAAPSIASSLELGYLIKNVLVGGGVLVASHRIAAEALAAAGGTCDPLQTVVTERARQLRQSGPRRERRTTREKRRKRLDP